MQTPSNYKKGFTFSYFIKFIVGICIVYFIKLLLFPSPHYPYAKANADIQSIISKTSEPAYSLNNFVDSLNTICPIQIDSLTTLQGVKCLAKDTLLVSYKLDVVRNKYLINFLKKGLVKEITPGQVKNVKLNEMLGFDVSYIYRYNDKNQNHICDVHFYPTNNYQGE